MMLLPFQRVALDNGWLRRVALDNGWLRRVALDDGWLRRVALEMVGSESRGKVLGFLEIFVKFFDEKSSANFQFRD